LFEEIPIILHQKKHAGNGEKHRKHAVLKYNEINMYASHKNEKMVNSYTQRIRHLKHSQMCSKFIGDVSNIICVLIRQCCAARV